MFNIKSGPIDLWCPACPTRTGRSGKAHLALKLPGRAEPFYVAAHDSDRTSATVNGVPVWDFEENDWVREIQDDDTVTPWEDLAEAAAPVVGVSDLDGLAETEDTDAQSLIDTIRTEATDALKRADDRIAAAKEIAAKVAEENQALKARVAELEGEIDELLADEGDDEEVDATEEPAEGESEGDDADAPDQPEDAPTPAA